jgi:hypothetical protein
VSHDGHLVVRGVNLTSYAFAKETSSSVNNVPGKSGYSPHLSIPLAFKSIMSRSTENLLSDEKTGTDIISGTPSTLSERHDLGILIPDTTPDGMTIRDQGDGQLQGIVWFREEITVRLFIEILVMDIMVFSDV